MKQITFVSQKINILIQRHSQNVMTMEMQSMENQQSPGTPMEDEDDPDYHYSEPEDMSNDARAAGFEQRGERLDHRVVVKQQVNDSSDKGIRLCNELTIEPSNTVARKSPSQRVYSTRLQNWLDSFHESQREAAVEREIM
jgi:hypothetical protein